MAATLDMIEAMKVLTLQPGDALVLKVDARLTRADASSIAQHVCEALGDIPVLVLERGMDLGVLRKE